jgi:hypothetical protein
VQAGFFHEELVMGNVEPLAAAIDALSRQCLLARLAAAGSVDEEEILYAAYDEYDTETLRAMLVRSMEV